MGKKGIDGAEISKTEKDGPTAQGKNRRALPPVPVFRGISPQKFFDAKHTTAAEKKGFVSCFLFAVHLKSMGLAISNAEYVCPARETQAASFPIKMSCMCGEKGSKSQELIADKKK